MRRSIWHQFTYCLKVYFELTSLADRALDFNRTSHLLDDLFADAEAQAGSIWVLGGAECLEVDKQFLELLLAHSVAIVSNSDLEVDLEEYWVHLNLRNNYLSRFDFF